MTSEFLWFNLEKKKIFGHSVSTSAIFHFLRWTFFLSDPIILIGSPEKIINFCIFWSYFNRFRGLQLRIRLVGDYKMRANKNIGSIVRLFSFCLIRLLLQNSFPLFCVSMSCGWHCEYLVFLLAWLTVTSLSWIVLAFSVLSTSSIICLGFKD